MVASAATPVYLSGSLSLAIGEAFDKVAKLLGLAYPGGPHVEREAAKGNPERFDLPRPMQGRPSRTFRSRASRPPCASRRKRSRRSPSDIADLCASFQAAVVDVVVDRTRVGLRAFRDIAGHPTALVVAGGVAANQGIRQALQRLAVEAGLASWRRPLQLCGDNGAMIAWAGLERMRLGLIDDIGARPAPAGPSIPAATRPGQGLMAPHGSDRHRWSGRLGHGARQCGAGRRQRRDPLDAHARAGGAIAAARANERFLPGRRTCTTRPADRRPVGARRRRAVLLVTPAQTTREMTAALAEHPAARDPLVLCAKGIERETRRLPQRRGRARCGPARPSRSCRDRASPTTWRAACRPP